MAQSDVVARAVVKPTKKNENGRRSALPPLGQTNTLRSNEPNTFLIAAPSARGDHQMEGGLQRRKTTLIIGQRQTQRILQMTGGELGLRSQYINGIYNPRRRHSAIGEISSVKFERISA